VLPDVTEAFETLVLQRASQQTLPELRQAIHRAQLQASRSARLLPSR